MSGSPFALLRRARVAHLTKGDGKGVEVCRQRRWMPAARVDFNILITNKWSITEFCIMKSLSLSATEVSPGSPPPLAAGVTCERTPSAG